MKCLVISHNPFSTFQNMGKTFLSLFSEFSPEELCQFYIYPSVPDVEKCHSYFRVTDKEILKSYYTFSTPGGEVTPCTERHDLYEDPTDEARYRSPKNKTTSRMLARDLMWKLSRRNNKKLNAWLDREQPSCIFVAPGPYRFIYDVALRISKQRNIPIVAYVCDDYYFTEKPRKLLERYRVKKLQKKIRALMARASHIVTICDELKNAYANEFHKPATTIMTPSNYDVEDATRVCKTPTTITYMGNIRCNRYLSLAKLGKALDAINETRGTQYALHIYSAEKNAEILSHFDGIRSIQFRGFVAGEEFLRVFRSAELLLHAEAFDDASIDLVKHSVSTKIADSLSCGIPLVAYAPSVVASMSYLVENGAALCITEKDDLQQKLTRFFEDAALREQVAATALTLAHKNHTSSNNSRLMRAVLGDACQK